MDNPLATIVSIVAAIVILLLCIGGCMVGCPKYNVYSQRMEGEALLAHSQSAKEVSVSEAKAKMEAASLLAQAEVERAKGVAQANKIIGDSLRDNEAYLRYLFVNNLENTKNQVIYIPTEANLPILEAARKGGAK
jgi:regulator of protease activity HflC (stomatin/prohibitin superfamily)